MPATTLLPRVNLSAARRAAATRGRRSGRGQYSAHTARPSATHSSRPATAQPPPARPPPARSPAQLSNSLSMCSCTAPGSALPRMLSSSSSEMKKKRGKAQRLVPRYSDSDFWQRSSCSARPDSASRRPGTLRGGQHSRRGGQRRGAPSSALRPELRVEVRAPGSVGSASLQASQRRRPHPQASSTLLLLAVSAMILSHALSTPSKRLASAGSCCLCSRQVGITSAVAAAARPQTAECSTYTTVG